jgi:hypothetical protein
MAARKRRKRSYRDFMMDDSGDGLEINRLNAARFIGRRHATISMFDADNIVIELNGETENGRHFHKVSVLGEVRRVNRSKTRRINGYKQYIKGR